MSFVQIPRESIDKFLWDAMSDREAFMDLFVIANYKEGYIKIRNWERILIYPWEVWWSNDSLATRWKWSRWKVSRFLNVLEKEWEIEQQNFGINFKKIRLLWWIIEQQIEQQTDDKWSNKRTTNDTLSNNEDKENKENKTPKIPRKKKNGILVKNILDPEEIISKYESDENNKKWKVFLFIKEIFIKNKIIEPTYESFIDLISYTKEHLESSWLDVPSWLMEMTLMRNWLIEWKWENNTYKVGWFKSFIINWLKKWKQNNQ